MTTRLLTLSEARAAAADTAWLASLIKQPVEDWGGHCHEVSLALLRTGAFGPGRVARGWHPAVASQHSWIVLTDDSQQAVERGAGAAVYDPEAVIVDPTLEAWRARAGRPLRRCDCGPAGAQHAATCARRPRVIVGLARNLPHTPHGAGFLHDQGKRNITHEPVIQRRPWKSLSRRAQEFLIRLGPLDHKAWAELASGPLQGWPSGEIIAAMRDTPELRALVPIDAAGMLTDENPGGLYR